MENPPPVCYDTAMSTGHVPFFYVDASSKLLSEDADHFVKVLRGKEGDPLHISDGAGRTWKAVAHLISRREVEAVRGDEFPAERPPAVSLATALPKGQRASYLIEKSVEFGLSDLTLLNTQFASSHDCHPGLLRRLQAIADSAGMQARHPWRCSVRSMQNLSRFLESDRCLAVLDSQGTRAAWEKLDARTPWTLLVGPEGGWAPEELALFEARGLPLLSLTRHPLRMETAAVAGLAFWYALKEPQDDRM